MTEDFKPKSMPLRQTPHPVFKATNFLIQAANLAENEWKSVGNAAADATIAFNKLAAFAEPGDFEVVSAKGSPKDELTASFVGDMLKDKSITVTTEMQHSNWEEMNELFSRVYGPVMQAREQFLRSVCVVGMAPVAHRHPGLLEFAESRVAHTRARKLYSERLRRDRRARRKGRKPILRQVPLSVFLKSAKITSSPGFGPLGGMEVIASPYLPSGTVAMMDTGALARMVEEQPIDFGGGLKDVAKQYLGLGNTPSRVWIDEVPHYLNGLDS